MDCIAAAIWCLTIQMRNVNNATEMKKNAIRSGTDFTDTIILPQRPRIVPVIAIMHNAIPAINPTR